MVADTISLINIQNFCIKDCTLPSLPAQYLQLSPYHEEDSKEEHVDVVINTEKISLSFAKKPLCAVPIKSAKVLSSHEDFKEIIEITFDIKDFQFNFQPGDTVGILPENLTEDVDFLLESLRLSPVAHSTFQLGINPQTTKKGAKLPIYLPKKFTLHQLFKYFLNITAVPKKLFLRPLVECTEDENEKFFLKTLCSKEGSKIYSKLTEELSLNFLTILKLCPSCHPTVELLIEHLPRLLPRPYSIANSPLINKDEIKICFSVIRENPGLTTNLLKNLTEQFAINPNEKFNVNLYLRESNKFCYTLEEFDKNIIMIGIGCAVSPYLGFLQHHLELLKENKLNGEAKSIWLLNGCKCKENSIYGNKFKEFMNQGILTKYCESFSRDETCKWNYVQDAIRENKIEFIELLMNQDTILYLCADGAEISRSIQNCIVDCIMDVNNCNKEDAEAIIKKLKVDSRYREDIW